MTEKNVPHDYYRDVHLDSLADEEELSECTVCFSLVINRIDHLKWHKRLNSHLRKIGKDSKKAADAVWDWPEVE